MVRSFTDRLLGGVCGGLGASFRINAWFFRLIFVVGAFATGGAAAILYAALWLALPQGSLIVRKGGLLSTLAFLILVVFIIGGWAAERAGMLPMPSGQSVYFPTLIALFGLILITRQVKA